MMMMMCASRTLLLISFFLVTIGRITIVTAFVTSKDVHANTFRTTKVSHDTSIRYQSLSNYNQQTETTTTSTTQADIVTPPEPLQSLPIGSSWKPYNDGPLVITRLCADPDIFLFKNHIPHEQGRTALMKQAEQNGWEVAKTALGQQKERFNSYLSWVQHYIHEDEDDIRDKDEISTFGSYVAQGMTKMSAQFLLSSNYENYYAEPVQIVKYNEGGKFDLHHDGLGRAVTCLTYLNGVAGTWFPYAALKDEDYTMVPHPDPNGHPTTMGLSPGQNGIWMAGTEADEFLIRAAKQGHVVHTEPGDAIAFYNYKWVGQCEEYDNQGNIIPLSSSKDAMKQNDIVAKEDFTDVWRTYHVALPTNREKWIATNWFKAGILPDSEK